jgi:hypothetical protein
MQDASRSRARILIQCRNALNSRLLHVHENRAVSLMLTIGTLQHVLRMNYQGTDGGRTCCVIAPPQRVRELGWSRSTG